MGEVLRQERMRYLALSIKGTVMLHFMVRVLCMIMGRDQNYVMIMDRAQVYKASKTTGTNSYPSL